MKKRVFFIVAAIIATLFIFSNSVQEASISDQKSDFFVEFIADEIRNAGHSPRRLYITRAVRKTAHVLEFALQGLLITGCFSIPRRRRIIYVLFLGFLTGCIDESIQLFTPGRSAMIQDVFVDLLGTVIGVLTFGIISRLKHKLKKG